MNNKTIINEEEKIERFYNDLICKFLEELQKKYADRKSSITYNPDVRCAMLADENRFYDDKNNKSFRIETNTYVVSKDENINIYNIYESLHEIFEYWANSYYEKMAVYFDGCHIFSGGFAIVIGFTLYDYNDISEVNIFNVDKIN